MVLTMVELTLVDIGGDTNDGEGEDNILRILELCGTGPWFIKTIFVEDHGLFTYSCPGGSD